MRKYTKLIVLGGALAALAIPSIASANVAVDNGVGLVDKGDVQTALKWNNSDFDKGVGSLKFTAGTQTLSNTTRWQCSGGEQNRTSNVTQKRNVKATTLYSSNGKQITGWDLTGASAGDFVSGGYTGAPYVGYCPAGEAFQRFLPNVFTTDVSDGGLRVNDIALPNTPVGAPAV